MGKIRILSDRIANQIAAGEVIERPAAVVKELIENAIDAGAERIEVEFRRGGRSYMRVEDDGRGMSKDDALLSLERHGTSKIAAADDLNRIVTFGFRGEALPSIASVSRFTLQTRQEGAEHGTEIVVNGGKVVQVRECGMPVGTRIEVAQLFNSVPARRKFLKTDATESAHIIQCARLHAIAHPSVAFKVIENDRTVFQSASCPGLEERLAEVFGRSLASLLMPIEATEGDMHLSGFIGRPSASRATRHEMLVFVNSRPVESRTLGYALLESYHGSIPKGRYPIAFLFLKIDPAAVDVNVHPAKREVRFREEARVRGFVIRTVLERLRGDLKEQTSVPASAPERNPGWRPNSAAPSAAAPSASERSKISPPLQRSAAPVRPVVAPAPVSPPTPVSASAETFLKTVPEPERAKPVSTGHVFRWRFIGQARGNLALFETAAGVVVMDRRAAHERLMYEEILAKFRKGAVPRQALLFPVPLELDPVATALLADHLDLLNGNGFEISVFGRNFFRIESVPPWLEPNLAEGFVRDLLALIREKGLPEEHPELAWERIALLASRKAIRINDRVTEEEIVGLARRLMESRNPLTSPLGRATFFEIGSSEIERRLQK